MSNYFDHLSVLFVCEQRKHRTSSHVYDDYEDIDGAEENKSVYRGNIIVVVLLLLLHPFNSLFSRTTWVSRHQKGKPFWILYGSGISWTICKLVAPCSRQITTPVPLHSVFTGQMSFSYPTNSVKALKALRQYYSNLI